MARFVRAGAKGKLRGAVVIAHEYNLEDILDTDVSAFLLELTVPPLHGHSLVLIIAIHCSKLNYWTPRYYRTLDACRTEIMISEWLSVYINKTFSKALSTEGPGNDGRR